MYPPAWQPHPLSGLALGILLLDQVTDVLVEVWLPAGASHLFGGGWLGVMRPASLSPSLQDANRCFVLAAVLIVPFLWWYKRKVTPDRLYGVAAATLLGGLLANLADSLRTGYPVDYLLIGKPVSVADIAVVIGGGLLLRHFVAYRIREQDH